MEDINLHFTGDLHAVAAAHNLLAAASTPTLPWQRAGHRPGDDLLAAGLDVKTARCADASAWARRAVPRESEWHITAASEVMAILALAADIHDLRQRLGRVIVGENYDGGPVTPDELKVAGAMAVLRRTRSSRTSSRRWKAGRPLHAGPFATSPTATSVIADRIGLKLVDAVVTEAASPDLGFEKFVDIVCRPGGLSPETPSSSSPPRRR